jgi:hypothetical protein
VSEPVLVRGILARMRDFLSQTASIGHGLDDYAPRELGLLDPMPYRLTVNGRIVTRGTLQEIRAAVAELVTTRLAGAPEGLAIDAQMLNMAFNSGAVQEALDEGGEWFTIFGADGPARLHIRVTKE